jgi:predicted PhzF superfamily epimerase YddE/YHI9
MPSPVAQIPVTLLEGLSAQPAKVLRNDQAYFAIFNDVSTVKSLETNSELLKQLAPYDVVVSAPDSGQEYDFISRYFWPANGGDEDPVTGSIHTGLGPYWAQELGINSLTAYQASKRGGVLFCQVTEERVLISGHAVHYLNRTITV